MHSCSSNRGLRMCIWRNTNWRTIRILFRVPAQICFRKLTLPTISHVTVLLQLPSAWHWILFPPLNSYPVSQTTGAELLYVVWAVVKSIWPCSIFANRPQSVIYKIYYYKAISMKFYKTKCDKIQRESVQIWLYIGTFTWTPLHVTSTWHWFLGQWRSTKICEALWIDGNKRLTMGLQTTEYGPKHL